ncbi:MAG: M67 family metallopeptidase [Thermoprotei archaeon]
MRLLIKKNDIEKIVKKAVKSSVELAGFLIGIRGSEDFIVKYVYDADASDNTKVSFKIKPNDTYNAIKQAESEKLEIIGIYHTHPAPPEPSSKDHEGMKAWPGIWLIIDSRTGRFSAWNEKFEKVVIEII